jgi:PAS domain S-box-containing protein
VHPEDLPQIEEASRRCMRDHRPLEVQYRIIWPDGSLHWIDTKAVYLYDSDGVASRMLGVVMDITEHKQIEDELHESEARFRTMSNAIPQLAWVAQADGYIYWYNQRWYDYTGTMPEQMVGWGWQSVHDPGVLPEAMKRWQASLATGAQFDMTFPMRGADGIFRPFLTRVIPLKDVAGRVQQWFGTATDVSELEQRVAERTKELADTINHLQCEIWERELAESSLRDEIAGRLRAVEALREKEQMLIQQSRQAAMGEMIGNIAHQWRQPLNTLGLFTQRLGFFYGQPTFDKEFLDSSVAKSMEIIQHMSRTIDDFRNYFKPDKEMCDFNVSDAIKSTLSLLEGSFQNPKIDIVVVENENPVIHGFQNEFAQVLLNILANAREAIIERGIVDPQVTITTYIENGCSVISIADNAGGIPEEIIDKVFDPYFTTKGPQQGTGVGLFMSKTIIEKNMGGTLVVRNTDVGAEFKIEVGCEPSN